ncbi:ATP synthase subunit I [Glaciecola sp. MH2013]|uniref:ATP synthase subunit I n=1 Tax=Glaciecola sp. MH2013 TaxID=2785524 RepID=UPI0018A07313|nr:ATP synthase subunit I [Glaciecola sp. MH2013]MBF7074642.1 ATP synthase subunit I [Glaciecola sp. MH2013]
MPVNLANNGKELAKKGIIAQCLSSLALIVIVLFIKPEHTIAVIIGSLSFIIPHSFFAYWSFRYAGATKSHLVVQSFSQGLKIKLALTTLFFVIAFSQLNAAPLPFFGAYVLTIASQWLAMFRLRHMS